MILDPQPRGKSQRFMYLSAEDIIRLVCNILLLNW